jgi:hypothetical protein
MLRSTSKRRFKKVVVLAVLHMLLNTSKRRFEKVVALAAAYVAKY